jgi:hypothetical protein
VIERGVISCDPQDLLGTCENAVLHVVTSLGHERITRL